MFYRQLVKTSINSFGRRTRLVATMVAFSKYTNSVEKWSTRRIPEFEIRNFSSKIGDSKSSTAPFSGELTNEDIDKMVKSDKVVAFIKGVPEQPMCGFSKLVVQILDMHGVKFTSFDVLENDSLRRNMKLYSNWPTFPQVFIDGKLVGGADIMLEMHKNKELVQLLEKVGIKSAYSNEE